jgi:cellulose synthase (UDP-forming)
MPLQQVRSPLPKSMSKETKYQRSVRYLMLPPSQEEMYSYSERYHWWIAIPSLLSFLGLCISQVRFALAAPWLWGLLPFLVFTITYYSVSMITSIATPDFYVERHKLFIAQWKQDRYIDDLWPSIDIFLPICGESIIVLQNTWKLVLEMRKIYPGTCTVYVLDDGDSPKAKYAAKAFGFEYVVRPNRGEMKKAGNLKNAYHISNGDAILILDADFCPHRDMLMHMLPYMWENPRVGIVQSPQYFRTTSSQNWLERGAGTVQELFYRYIQVCRNHYSGAICVGTCALYRRAAWDSIGGPYQIEHSEDVWGGVMCGSKGWGLEYIPINLSAGLCPSDYGSFVRQQYRWCLGSMSLIRSKQFWQIKMPFMTRLCYASGFFYYWHTALFTFVMPIIPIILVSFLPQQINWVNYALLLPCFFYGYIVFPLWHKSDYRLDSGFIDAMATKMVYGWAHAFTIFDLLRGRPLGWRPTGSSSTSTRTHWHVRHSRLLLFTWGGMTGVTWIGLCMWRMANSSTPWNFSLIFLTGLINLLVVLRASVGASG